MELWRCTPSLTLRCMNFDDFSYISRTVEIQGRTITSASNDMRKFMRERVRHVEIINQ